MNIATINSSFTMLRGLLILLFILVLSLVGYSQGLTITGGAQVVLNGSAYIVTDGTDGNISIDGALDLGSGDLIIDGDFTVNGTLGAASGAVSFTGSSAQLVSGSTTSLTFNSLDFAAGTNVSVQAGHTLTASAITASGTSINTISLQSATQGLEFTLSQASGTVDGTYLILEDVHGIGGTTFNATNSVDNGNNDGWNFVTDLSDGLVAYYPFNGNTNDESGNGNNANALGGVSLSTDRFGNANSAYSFDGVDDYMTSAVNLSTNQAFSLSAWVYWNGANADYQEILSWWNSSQGQSPYLGTGSNSSEIRFGDTWNATGVNLPVGSWVHIVAV